MERKSRNVCSGTIMKHVICNKSTQFFYHVLCISILLIILIQKIIMSSKCCRARRRRWLNQCKCSSEVTSKQQFPNFFIHIMHKLKHICIYHRNIAVHMKAIYVYLNGLFIYLFINITYVNRVRLPCAAICICILYIYMRTRGPSSWTNTYALDNTQPNQYTEAKPDQHVCWYWWVSVSESESLACVRKTNVRFDRSVYSLRSSGALQFFFVIDQSFYFNKCRSIS